MLMGNIHITAEIGANGNHVSFADFTRTRDVATHGVQCYILHLGQLPAGLGNIIGRWQLDFTVRGWPRPTANTSLRTIIPELPYANRGMTYA